MTFKIGQSGNPKGRVKGTPNKRTQLAKLLEPYAEKLIEKMIELALGGDTGSLRLCIERLIPKINSESTGIELPAELNKTSFAKLKRETLSAAFEGRISIDNAEKILKLVHNQYSKNPSLTSTPELPRDPVEASKIYQQIMG